MSRQRHIGEVPVHGGRCENQGLIDGDALAFVDGRSIAVVDMGVGCGVERDRTPAIKRDGETIFGRHDNGSEHAVLYSDGVVCADFRRQAAVFEKQDAVTWQQRSGRPAP